MDKALTNEKLLKDLNAQVARLRVNLPSERVELIEGYDHATGAARFRVLVADTALLETGSTAGALFTALLMLNRVLEEYILYWDDVSDPIKARYDHCV